MAMAQDHTFAYKNITDKKKKNLSILDCIRRRNETSRAEISKETGINIVSVSNYLNNYIKKGLVFECGRDISTGGRRPELLRLNLESAYVAGLDIGPERLIAIITNLALKIKARISIPRPVGDMDKVVEGAIGMLEKLFKESGRPLTDIKLIGVGASGVMDSASGTIRDTDPTRKRTKANLFTLVRSIEEKFNITTLFGNDATCAAFGEIALSLDTEIRELLYIYSDIGCGIIINRDIYCGTTGSAGEVQLLVDNTGRKQAEHPEIASYGVRGIDLGVVARAKGLVEKDEGAGIMKLAKDKDAITKEIIFTAAQQNDKLARKLLTDAAYWLGVKIAYLVNIFNPQVVVIGGGMEKAGGVFMDTLYTCAKMYTFEESFRAAKIVPSFLGEDAIAAGAAALAVRELFIKAY